MGSDQPTDAATAAAARSTSREERPEATRSIEAILDDFRDRDYIADRSLATAVFLALELGRPLLLEGEAGVGKTELAKVLAASLGTRLIRLQCYEGLDVNTAVYEWNYPRQMLEIRLLEARGEAEQATAHDIFGADFLIRGRSSRRSRRPTASRRSCSSTRSTAPTRSSRRTCSRSCPTSRSRSRRSARSRPRRRRG